MFTVSTESKTVMIWGLSRSSSSSRKGHVVDSLHSAGCCIVNNTWCPDSPQPGHHHPLS